MTNSPLPEHVAKLIRPLIDHVIGIEGDYVNDPNDSGGATRWGITERMARVYGYTGEMRYLPRDKAVEIYEQHYFLKPKFHLIADISAAIAAEMFEIEVNLPPGKAVFFLQRALNGLNDQQKLYADQEPDGKVGNDTVGSLKSFLQRRGADGEAVLLKLINAQQAVYYLERAENRPQNEKFLYGWVKNRT